VGPGIGLASFCGVLFLPVGEHQGLPICGATDRKKQTVYLSWVRMTVVREPDDCCVRVRVAVRSDVFTSPL
jgi:hypothetical protein